MQLKKYAFGKLPFTQIFNAYIGDFPQTADIFETNPHQPEAIKKRAASFDFAGNRQESSELLQAFNEQFSVDDAALQNIERLAQDDALAIVTGQQLGLYGGPLYTIYKTLTTIQLARKWEQKLDRPVIPVFWLADEDHDYDEVKSVRVITGDGSDSFSLPDKQGDLPPVSDLQLPKELNDIRSALKYEMYDTDFSGDLWQLLDECFTPGATFSEAFGKYIARLFSKHGLVLAGSNDRSIKEHTKNLFKRTLKNADELRDALETQSQKIEQRFHQQASIYDSHLFYIDSEKGRLKIQRNGKNWHTGAGQEWSCNELMDEIEENPEQFSPDVFLRPVLQDCLLPTLGYVAGPGEIAYYGQMKTFYHCFDRKMPVIFPRLSATLVEPAVDRIFHELPFEFGEYNNRIEDLESEFVEQTETTDIEALFRDWKEKAESVAESPIETIADIDETLEGAAKKAQATYFNELDQLKGKVYRAVKKSEEIQLNRIRRIQHNFFPERGLQERTICGIYYMNKFGLDIWDRLLNEMDENLSLDSHTLVYL